MINDCLRLGLQTGDFSFQGIKRACLSRMAEYQVHDAYRISAMFEASNVLKKFRTDSQRKKVSTPVCRRPYLAVSLGVWLEGDSISLPEIGRIKLTPHTISVLSQEGVGVTSVTLTPRSCSVIYHKSVEQVVPEGMLAVDLNLDNITTFDTEGSSDRYDLSALTAIHETYRRVKSRFRRNDVRIRRDLFRKYADIEFNRKNAIMHRISSELVNRACAKRQAVVLEDLRGLREMYRRDSGQSSYYLSKMNAWPFRQILSQIAYKAEWLGLPVLVISPEWTSEECSDCGGNMEKAPVEENLVVCLGCGLVIDRDLNGAKNILQRGLRSGLKGFADEAMMAVKSPERGPNAGVDANHPSSHDE
jgi:IS605 OrfB family transposase